MMNNNPDGLGKTGGDQQKPVVLKGKPNAPKIVTPSEDNADLEFLQETTVSRETPDFKKILHNSTKYVGPPSMAMINGGEKASPVVRMNADLDPNKVNYKAVKSNMPDGSDLPS